MHVTDTLAIEHVPLDELTPDPANPRSITPAELDALERSMRRWGNLQPIIARVADRVVIAGHQRLVAARRLGHATIPVIFVDLSTESGRALGVALNKISGTWDEKLLVRLLAELDAVPDLDLTLTGFGEDELEDLLRRVDVQERRDRPEVFDLDAAIEQATKQPRAKRGDVWQVGEHRVMCGDATNRGDVERLLGEQRARMAFTDPPYNVDYGRHGGHQRGTRRRTIANDALGADEWEAFVTSWCANLVAATDGALYVCMSTREWPTLTRLLAEAGGHWSDTIIWAKDRFVLGRADYQHAFEPLWYGWRDGVRRHWCGDRDQSNVWQIARPSDAPLHPVMKPLALMERAICNSSRPRDLVLDLFLGSGSTLIACERTNRRCLGLELDPVYVDVALARWERFSGEVAVRADE